MNLSKDLEAIIGPGPMTRSQACKKIWAYIEANKLQNQAEKLIRTDPKLKKILEDKESVTGLELTRLVGKHLS